MVAEFNKPVAPKIWAGGSSRWLSRAELISKPKLFPITSSVLDMIDTNTPFREEICVYSETEY